MKNLTAKLITWNTNIAMQMQRIHGIYSFKMIKLMVLKS